MIPMFVIEMTGTVADTVSEILTENNETVLTEDNETLEQE